LTGFSFYLINGANSDISRVRGVHFQGVQGRSRSRLLQALDNAVNERLVHARRVKNFEKLKKNLSVQTVTLKL
jgi:hypothetical protein